ncbi:hypothetical protein [Alkalicoccobacillus plakortidis]|uniref:Uncharacterized protein n=1 Tax=Alkalicoccobacillus plakortidis TaxID=444060 RepID=A0ABT0XPN9_9BACI|nr:hypothetical protein [Alkalicoccobacillus plakortidis]MCM2677876.1 hypothetical protein [Alkalicoccobacillus plakortidis]
MNGKHLFVIGIISSFVLLGVAGYLGIPVSLAPLLTNVFGEPTLVTSALVIISLGLFCYLIYRSIKRAGGFN